MSKQREMRSRIQRNRLALAERKRKEREQKRKEREAAKKNKPYVSPFERKHGRKPSRSDDMPKPKSKKTKLTGRERAQQMARERIAAKKAGTYKKPKTAQELAKERLKIKKKKK